MTRNRDVLQVQFADIQAKLREADIARNLETEQKGERFSQIRSPGVASTPYSPNRIGIVLLGIVLGGGLAVGLAAFAESSDPSVRSSKDLRELTKLPAIASVPVMLNADDRRRQRLWWGSYAVVLILATAFVATTALLA
jgi:capsular polysaccharide biosynthesis protein